MEEHKQNILIVDDTPSNIDILLELLSNEYEIFVALDGKSALEIAIEEKIDLILLDIIMPELNGFDTSRLLKLNPLTKEIPIIFITAKTDEESIEKAYDVGGIDYVTKPFKPKELLARVKTQLELKNLIKHLEYISSHDVMTGIYNRRKFFELAVDKFNKHKKDLFCVMIDIDNFKTINDKYGHPLGDKVIKVISGIIKEKLCDRAIFGRLGGEEFSIVCNVSDIDILMSYIETMRKAVEEQIIQSECGQEVNCTISAGISFAKEDTASLDALLQEADKALYEAKGNGRNRSVLRKER